MSSDGDFITGFIIGFVLVGTFKVAWFVLRSIWWLALFLILSSAAGIAALARRGSSGQGEPQGFGEYSTDCTQWQDQATGQQYPVSHEESETCVIAAEEGRIHWRKTAMSRLIRAGAIFECRFLANSTSSNAEARYADASVTFYQEARHGVTIDHLDPALASTDMYNLQNNRESATAALAHLEWILAQQGWRFIDRPEGHWYAKRYERPIIL